jgi:hypothetical protein
MNELVRRGHRPGTDGFRQVSEPSQDDAQLRDAFSALNKLRLWNRLAFSRRAVRALCTQLASEFPSNTPPVLIRQAVIMVGEKGIRPSPSFGLHPKALIQLGDMPILELLLRRLKAIGIHNVILAVNQFRHSIEAHLGDGSNLGLRISYYSSEGKPLGPVTLGNMLDLLDDTFFLIDSELLTTIDLRRMALTHVCERADASIGVSERETRVDLGLIEF